MIIGKDTAKSDYVNWEIKTAAEMGKRIVGVYLQGAKEEDIPPELIEHGHNLVGWNGDRIVRAIDGEDMDWEKPDESPRRNNPMELSTCKPLIREWAQVGDWVAAYGSASSMIHRKLVMLMRVGEIP